MAKWVFYVLVFVYMCYRAVYGARVIDTSITVDQIHYEEDGYLKVGTRKTVSCRASNKNQKLEWVDPFDNVVKRIPSSRVHAQEHFVSSPKGIRTPSLVLTFSELAVSDSGLYQCKSGEQKKTARVCVIQPSEFAESDSIPTEVTIEAGRSITLACQAKGDPEPRLAWRRNDEELAEGIEHPKYKVNRRYKIEGYESLLTITDVEPEDAGFYYCLSTQESPMLDNCTYSDERNVTLQVKYKPVFEDEEEKASVFGVNEIVNIKCEARGWPKPTYRWFKDLGGGALYEFDKSKIVFSEDPYTAVLSVTAGPTTYGNVYKCTASNEFGNTDKFFKLLKRDKPSKAHHIDAITISGSSIHFNMSWDDSLDFPVDSYSIQYIPSSEVESRIPSRSDWLSDQTILVHVESDEDKDIIEGSSQGIIVKLHDLEPETGYFVRMKAINKAGEAPWSEAVHVSTTNEVEKEPETVAEEENDVEEAEESEDEPNAAAEVNTDTGMFYGVFFTGAILIVAVVCMFAMRMV